jgi:dihydroorotase
MPSLLITNALMVNEGRRFTGDLRIEGQRIAAIGTSLAARPGETVIDAAGKLLMPGMIDDQVHFREPGLVHKGDIATESRAAVAGGITSVMEMPNVKPPTTSLEALEAKHALAASRSVCNYSFYLGATNDNLDEIRRLKPGEACGIKVFMGASTGNMLVDDRAILDALFRDAPTLVVAHCEDTPTIKANEERFRAQYGDDIPVRLHGEIRSAEACWKSSSLAIELARRHDARLHVLHLTTEREMALFAPGAIEDKRITAEVCVHHLFFNDADYATKGALIKCNPAVKTEADRAALVQALLDDRIDVIATDHAPHLLEEKAGNYFTAPSGLPLVQHALLVALDFHRRGIFSLEKIVQKCCHAPATLFGVRERGFLREGYFADLVLVDLARPQTVRREDVLYKCGWSPFEGHTFGATIDITFVNGRIAWQGGKLRDVPAGMRLEFDRGR